MMKRPIAVLGPLCAAFEEVFGPYPRETIAMNIDRT
jgi:hypothetical protein